MLLIQFFIKTSCIAYQEIASNLADLMKNEEYFRVDTTKSYEFFYISFKENEIKISKTEQNLQFPKPISTIKTNKESVNNIIKVIKGFENVPFYRKILVIQKIDTFFHKKALQLIDNLIKHNFSFLPGKRFCLCFVNEDCFLYQIYKSSPISKDKQKTDIELKCELFSKGNNNFLNIATCLPRSCYLFTLNLDLTDKIGKHLKEHTIFNDYNIGGRYFKNLKLFKLIRFFDIHSSMSSNVEKIKLIFTGDVEVLENNSGDDKEDVGLKICKNEENIMFMGSNSDFIYNFDKSTKKHSNPNQSNSPKQLCEGTIVSNNSQELVVIKMEEERWIELNDIFMKCKKAIKDNFSEEELFFRFITSQKRSTKIIKHLLLSKSGNCIFFANLCQILNLIKKDELMILTNTKSEDNFHIKNINIDEIVKNIQTTMETLNDGIIYLMKLCLLFETDKLIINNDIFDLEVYYDIETVAKCIYMKKHSLSNIEDSSIPRNVFEEGRLFEVFKELGRQKTKLRKKIAWVISVFYIKVSKVIENYSCLLLD